MLDGLTLRPLYVASNLETAFRSFMLDREAMRCTAKTLTHYRYTVGSFVDWLEARDVHQVDAITAQHIRAYLVGLQRRGLKDTTQHAHARGIRAWLNWMVREEDLTVSPMAKVGMPRVEQRVPAPFSPEDVKKLLKACKRKTPTGARDYAICMVLLDTGLRAQECTDLHIGDINMRSGLTTVMGKGGKQRQVRAGAKARQAIIRMLAFRQNPANGEPLWMAYTGHMNEAQALTCNGIQTMLHRLGRRAGVMPCAPHRFRRTFALWCLRDGIDLHSLRMLMGHSDLTVLQRYLALAGQDIERAHIAHSPADNMLD